MSYLPTPTAAAPPELDFEVESENKLERFVHLFASLVTLSELARKGRRALVSPLVWAAGLGAVAVMYIPRRIR